LRKELYLFAGVRPVKLYPGVKSPLAVANSIDFVVIRENAEGLFVPSTVVHLFRMRWSQILCSSPEREQKKYVILPFRLHLREMGE